VGATSLSKLLILCHKGWTIKIGTEKRLEG
jgi:hypothetical protein